MAYTNIDLPTDYFNTVLWTGNNADNRSITGVGHQPDMVWQKTRNQGYSHSIFDNIRGVTKRIVPNDTASETTVTDFKSFDSDGFTIDQDALQLNATGDTNVGWCWKANGAGVSNTAGSITSTVSANTTSGFSIVSYTGNGTSGATVGHGIGSTIGMMLVKGRSFSDNWAVYHKSIGGTGLLELNGTGGTNTVSTRWNDTNAGATVFTLGNNSQVNGNGSTYIAYCFAEVKGYSKFGSYTGNGSTDGTFVYTGFKPAFVMTKSSSTGGTYYDWGMMDNKRANPFNVIDAQVCANLSDAENSANIGSQKIDFLSNGFKPRVNGSSHNGSGVTYIYMAFAENPFVSSKGIPCTAR